MADGDGAGPDGGWLRCAAGAGSAAGARVQLGVAEWREARRRQGSGPWVLLCTLAVRAGGVGVGLCLAAVVGVTRAAEGDVRGRLIDKMQPRGD